MMEWYQIEIHVVCCARAYLRQTERQTVGAAGLQCCLSCDSQTEGGETQTPRHGSPPDIRHHNMTSPLGTLLTSGLAPADCGVSSLEISLCRYICIYINRAFICAPLASFITLLTHWALFDPIEFFWSLDLVCRIVGFLSTLTLSSRTQLQHELHRHQFSSQSDIQRAFKVSRRDSWRL